MTLFNAFVPTFAKFYAHPNFKIADDVVPDLTGKVAIVTGGTGGIGYETALQLARKGAKVYIAGRSSMKGTAAVEKIIRTAGVSADRIQFMELDLADIKHTKAAAEAFLATSQPLNILVNNAGFISYTFTLTPRDKLESHIAVEVGHLVFTETLLPAIRRAGPGSRIVNVTSWGHHSLTKKVDFSRLSSPDGENELNTPLKRYGIQKSASIWSTMYLQRLVEKDAVYVNCCHPGAVQSDFNRDVGPTYGKVVGYVVSMIEAFLFQSVQSGALTQLYLATSPEVETKEIKGQYLWPVCKIQTEEVSALAKDEGEQKRYWEWAHSAIDAALARAD